MSQSDPQRGESVRVWPTHQRVPSNSNGGAWIPLSGKNVQWSAWWAQRLRDGDVVLTDPNPKPVAKAPAPPKGDE
jgi:hypothetical protein